MSVFGNTTEENLKEIIAEKDKEIAKLKQRNKKLEIYYCNTAEHIRALMKLMNESK